MITGLQKMFELTLSLSEKKTNKVLQSFDLENPFTDIDRAIIGLFESIIEDCKTIALLLERKNNAGVSSLARSAFEKNVYLKYILSENTKKRALAFLHGSQLRRLRDQKILLGNDKEGKQALKLLRISHSDFSKVYNSNISENTMSDIEKDYYEQFSCEKPKDWYDEDGKTKSFHSLCDKLDLLGEYALFYRMFSFDIHGKNIESSIQTYEVERGKSFVNIMKPSVEVDLISSVIGLILTECTRKFLGYYRLEDELNLYNLSLKVNKTVQF